MASITWDDVENHDAALAALDAAAQTDILAFVNTALAVVYWGGESSPKLKLGRIYLASHFAALLLPDGTGGAAVISESEGGISRMYASFSPSGSDPLFDKTRHGQAYRLLARTSFARGAHLL